MIKEAERVLRRGRGEDNPVEVLAHFSDSIDFHAPFEYHSCPLHARDSIAAARSAKNRGTFIIASCHDIGSMTACWGHNSSKCVQTDFNRLATSEEFYLHVGSRVGEIDEYRSMVQSITDIARPVTVGTVVITDTLSADVELVPNSMRPPGEYDARSRMVEWTLPITDSEEFSVSYAVVPSRVGQIQASQGAHVSFVDSEGASGFLTAASPVLTVTHACITPSPSPPPTDTPLPPPSQTPTPPPTGTPTPLPTSEPPLAIYLPLLLREPPCSPAQQSADFVLVLDTSSSMKELTRDGRTKLAAAVDAAGAFVAAVDLGAGSRVAVVTFDADARTMLDLSADRTAIQTTLEGLSTGRQTCIPCALEEAEAALARSPSPPDVARAVILLTDGRSNPRPVAEAAPVAERLKTSGVALYTIGLGDELDRNALRAMASRPGDFYETPDAEDLAAIYQQIALEIPCPPSRYWGRR